MGGGGGGGSSQRIKVGRTGKEQRRKEESVSGELGRVLHNWVGKSSQVTRSQFFFGFPAIPVTGH